jgi:hypothetical protein
MTTNLLSTVKARKAITLLLLKEVISIRFDQTCLKERADQQKTDRSQK